MPDRKEIMQLAEKWLKDHKDEMVADLASFVRIRSVSRSDLASPGAPFGAETVKMLNFALHRAAAYGFEVNNADGYYGLASFGDDDNSIGMIAHLDVVPEGVNWIHPPYGAEVEGDYMFGRGANDNKGAAIASMYVMRMVKELDIKMNHGLRLILGLSEETGMQDMQHYNECEKPCLVTLVPDAAFPVNYAQKGSLTAHAEIETGDEIAEFTGGEVDNMVPPVAECVLNIPFDAVKDALKDADKEKFEILEEDGNTRVIAHGVASHAASPENGVSAIHMLASLLKDSALLSGKSLKAVQAIAFLSQGYYGEHAGIACEDEDTGKTTMVVGVARMKKGAVEVHVDCRLSVKADLCATEDAMRNAVEGAGFALTHISLTKPVFMPKDDPRVIALMEAYKEITNDDAQPYTMGGGTYSRCLENAVTFGLGMPNRHFRPEDLPAGHGGAHAPDEYIHIPSLIDSTLIFFSSILRLDEIV